MKTTKLAVAAFLLFVGEAFAASAVSDVIARQRWPWSGKVDIDYTVTGDTTDVDFTATWDGQPTPVLLGTAFRVEAGQHRFEFDPAAAGLADRTTTGFAVWARMLRMRSATYCGAVQLTPMAATWLSLSSRRALNSAARR